VIRLSDVTKRYAGETEIGPVSLEIPKGGVVSLIGPNGAGKSTVLTMIGRLLAPDGGTIEVGGLDVHAAPSKQVAKTVSILRQENHFVTRLTVRQLVGFGRYPHSGGRLTQHDEDKISEAIDFLGLTDLEQRFLDQLSGGQRQRAYVAMVICQDTDYVLLDEPLNNLDMKHSISMLQHLRVIATELDKTIVMVMHDINFAAVYSDYIIGMREGKVLCHGTVDEIMTEQRLAELYDIYVPIHVIEGRRLGMYYWSPELPKRAVPAG